MVIQLVGQPMSAMRSLSSGLLVRYSFLMRPVHHRRLRVGGDAVVGGAVSDLRPQEFAAAILIAVLVFLLGIGAITVLSWL